MANDDLTRIDVVLVGLDREFNFTKLTRAILAIRKGAAFVAINRDPLLPIAEGKYLAGTGTMVAAIEAGSAVKPVVIGKPEPTLLLEALRQLGSQPEQTVMIGDNLGVDILAGQAAGTQTLLVFSGNDTPESLERSHITPTYVYNDLAALVRDLTQ